jgi:POT family proton-dependent oligopeptide transporter
MYVLGVAVLFVCSIPWMLDRGSGLPGLIVAMILISFALGGVKSSLPPLLGVRPENVHVNVKFR